MSLTGAKRTVIVACPTEYGGQIEHAADLAIALALHDSVTSCKLVTRPGASAYLGSLEVAGLEICEILPPRRMSRSGLAGRLRAPLQGLDLLREHLALRRICKSAVGLSTLVLESGKYPWPVFFGRAPRVEKVLFVHNAKPHFDSGTSTFRQRFLAFLERRALNGVDRAVTHGRTQLATISNYSSTPTSSVPLPLSSALPVSRTPTNDRDYDDRRLAAVCQRSNGTAASFALCIGELRPNKGIELAITSAGQANVPLLVAGKSEDPELAAHLVSLASDFPGVTVFDDFLTGADFERLIRTATLVVLPYSHFDAQSGVLSKAMRAGASVLATDLPALMDQAALYEYVTYASAKDPAAFRQGLADSFNIAKDGTPAQSSSKQTGRLGAGTEFEAPDAPAVPQADWVVVAAAVLAGQGR